MINLDIVKNISWKTQDCDSNTVLFYKFNNKDELEVSKFKERIKDIKVYRIIINNNQPKSENIINVSDEEFSNKQEELLNRLYPLNPNIKFIGVTGTNGKTTTVDLVRQLAIKRNKNILSVGTLGFYLNEKKLEDFSLTTPAYIDLRKFLFNYKDKIEIVAMELSSHALVQKRTGSLKFNCIGWTNLTQDHLDFHKTMDEYFLAKMQVFNLLQEGSVVCLPKGQSELIKKLKTQSIKALDPIAPVNNPFLKMNYNRENLAIAIDLLNSVGLTNFTEEEIENLAAPPGRFNILEFKDKKIVIDYAHTPDSLSSIGREIKVSFPNLSLVTVFGCGGDRDRSKRALMASAAEENSDFVILTSDNPRFEDPMQIAKDAEAGFTSTSYRICLEREEAISSAIKSEYNIVLIAGKGHEDYIDQNGVKRPYSDLKTVLKVFNHDKA